MCAWLHPQAIIQVQLGKLHAVKSLIWMGWRRSQSTTVEDQSSDCYIWYCPYEATKRPSAWSSQAFGAWKTNNTARNDMDTYENNISELKISRAINTIPTGEARARVRLTIRRTGSWCCGSLYLSVMGWKPTEECLDNIEQWGISWRSRGTHYKVAESITVELVRNSSVSVPRTMECIPKCCYENHNLEYDLIRTWQWIRLRTGRQYVHVLLESRGRRGQFSFANSMYESGDRNRQHLFCDFLVI